ncbi:MAG: O-antigen ligase family protein [Candidatus Rokubacteria bacterium]|nr:O-antigen ligase family protein [Candidatus Rokubacteria bacterium]
MLTLARAADRSLLALLPLLMLALMTSITAVGVLTALLALAGLARLGDPALRARQRVPLAAPLAAFVAATLASVAAAPDPLDALYQSKHLLSLILFLAAVNGFRSGDAIRRALAWFTGAVVLASCWALAQTWVCTTAVDVPGWLTWALKVRLERCRQPSIEPFRAKGFFSIYMTLGGSLVVALALHFAALALGTRRHAWKLAPPAGLAFVALGLTYVRNAWLGLGAALGTLVLLSRRVSLILPLALGVTLALVLPTPLRGKLLTIVDLASPSATERLYFWGSGLRMVEDAPLLGLGPGGVRRSYPAYKHPDARRPGTSHLHNNLVQIAAERGLLGLAAWLWIWVAFVLRASRIYGALPPARADDRALVAGSLAAVVGFLTAGLFEYNFGDSEVVSLVWVVMAFPFVVAGGAGELPFGGAAKTLAP